MSVVLLLAWLPFAVSALCTPGLFSGDGNTPATAISTTFPATPETDAPERDDWQYILQELEEIPTYLQVLGPLLLLLWWRKNEFPFAVYGLVKPRWQRDLGATLLLFLATGLTEFVVNRMLPDPSPLHPDGPPSEFYPDGTASYVVMCFSLILNSVMEETVWRGYMLHRLHLLTGSHAFAILASAALFASYHVYQGFDALMSNFVWAVVYGLAFRWLRSLWPLVIAHTMDNTIHYLIY